MDPPGQLDVRSEGVRLPWAGHVTLMLPERQLNGFWKLPKKEKHSGTSLFKTVPPKNNLLAQAKLFLDERKCLIN